MSKEENLNLIRQCAALHTSHEIDKLVDLFTDDIVYDDVPLGVVANGRAELKGFFEATMTALPNWAMTIVSAFADEQSGAAEWIMTGTHVGDFPGYPASGKCLGVRASAIVKFSNGRISHWTDFWSLATFKEQLGFE